MNNLENLTGKVFEYHPHALFVFWQSVTLILSSITLYFSTFHNKDWLVENIKLHQLHYIASLDGHRQFNPLIPKGWCAEHTCMMTSLLQSHQFSFTWLASIMILFILWRWLDHSNHIIVKTPNSIITQSDITLIGFDTQITVYTPPTTNTTNLMSAIYQAGAKQDNQGQTGLNRSKTGSEQGMNMAWTWPNGDKRFPFIMNKKYFKKHFSVVLFCCCCSF